MAERFAKRYLIPREDLNVDAREAVTGLMARWRELTSHGTSRHFPSKRSEFAHRVKTFEELLKSGNIFGPGAAERHSRALEHYDLASLAPGGLLLEKRTQGILASAKNLLMPRRPSFELRRLP